MSGTIQAFGARPLAAIVTLISASLLSLKAEAVSFDCRRAALPAEKTICSDPNLGSLDERTAEMYFLIVGSQGAYGQYRQMVFQKNLADERRMTASMNQAAFDFGPWGPWGSVVIY